MIKNKDELYLSRNYKRLLGLNGFLKVPFTLAVCYDLTPAECMIYAYIKNATNNLKNKSFTDTETTLQAVCNISKSSVQRSLSNLINKGLVTRTKEKNEKGKLITVYRALRAVQLKIAIDETTAKTPPKTPEKKLETTTTETNQNTESELDKLLDELFFGK